MAKASTIIDVIAIELGIDSTKLKKGLQEAVTNLKDAREGYERHAKAMESISGNLTNAVNAMTTALRGLLAYIGIDSVAGFLNFNKSVAASTLAIEQLAEAMQKPTSEVSKYINTFKHFGGTQAEQPAINFLNGLRERLVGIIDLGKDDNIAWMFADREHRGLNLERTKDPLKFIDNLIKAIDQLKKAGDTDTLRRVYTSLPTELIDTFKASWPEFKKILETVPHLTKADADAAVELTHAWADLGNAAKKLGNDLTLKLHEPLMALIRFLESILKHATSAIENPTTTSNITGIGGAVVVGASSAVAGGYTGAIIGSPLGPVGTVTGGFIGVVTGFLGGAPAGGIAGLAVGDIINKDPNIREPTPPVNVPPEQRSWVAHTINKFLGTESSEPETISTPTEKGARTDELLGTGRGGWFDKLTGGAITHSLDSKNEPIKPITSTPESTSALPLPSLPTPIIITPSPETPMKPDKQSSLINSINISLASWKPIIQPNELPEADKSAPLTYPFLNMPQAAQSGIAGFQNLTNNTTSHATNVQHIAINTKQSDTENINRAPSDFTKPILRDDFATLSNYSLV